MPIAVTMGDPAGIGPELILKTIASGDDVVIFGNRSALERDARAMDLPMPDVAIIDPTPDIACSDLAWGKMDPRAARVQLTAFEAAMDAAEAREVDAIVTAPWTKSLFRLIDHPQVGHTELLEARFGASDHVMMLAGDRLRVALVTVHIPIAEVSKRLTGERIDAVIATTANDLQRLFGVRSPRIAVCGLNPHAGEAGAMGDEEITTIIPAIERMRERLPDVQLEGPFPSDTLFARYHGSAQPYDAVVCMYHDQGLIPLKTLHFGRSVNVTLGLPIIRTSVDHGTAYDIAGRGIANPGSLRYAIDVAAEMMQRVRRDDVARPAPRG